MNKDKINYIQAKFIQIDKDRLLFSERISEDGAEDEQFRLGICSKEGEIISTKTYNPLGEDTSEQIKPKFNELNHNNSITMLKNGMALMHLYYAHYARPWAVVMPDNSLLLTGDEYRICSVIDNRLAIGGYGDRGSHILEFNQTPDQGENPFAFIPTPTANAFAPHQDNAVAFDDGVIWLNDKFYNVRANVPILGLTQSIVSRPTKICDRAIIEATAITTTNQTNHVIPKFVSGINEVGKPCFFGTLGGFKEEDRYYAYSSLDREAKFDLINPKIKIEATEGVDIYYTNRDSDHYRAAIILDSIDKTFISFDDGFHPGGSDYFVVNGQATTKEGIDENIWNAMFANDLPGAKKKTVIVTLNDAGSDSFFDKILRLNKGIPMFQLYLVQKPDDKRWHLVGSAKVNGEPFLLNNSQLLRYQLRDSKAAADRLGLIRNHHEALTTLPEMHTIRNDKDEISIIQIGEVKEVSWVPLDNTEHASDPCIALFKGEDRYSVYQMGKDEPIIKDEPATIWPTTVHTTDGIDWLEVTDGERHGAVVANGKPIILVPCKYQRKGTMINAAKKAIDENRPVIEQQLNRTAQVNTPESFIEDIQTEEEVNRLLDMNSGW